MSLEKVENYDAGPVTRAMQFVSDCPSGVPTLASVPQALVAQQELLPGASVLAPRPPPQQPARQGRQQHEIVFHQTLCLLGRFSVHLSSTLTPSAPSDKAYAAHVFDKGTLFTPFCPDATVATLAAHLESSDTNAVSAHFTKNDRNRIAHDQVKIDLGRGRVFAVQKPGTALDVLYLVSRSALFFLQTTAISHLLAFVAKRSGAPWIRKARLVKDVGTVHQWIRNEDFEQLLRLCNQPEKEHNDITPRECGLGSAQYNRVPAPQMLGRVTVHASDRSVIVPMQRGPPFDHVAGGDARPYSIFLRDAQYPALSRSQSLICTSCIYCGRRFRFALEYFYHFVMMLRCREKLLGTSDPAGKTFSESLYSSVVRRFDGDVRDINLACTACGDVGQQGPLQYCMHRDNHRPAVPTFIGCQFCARVFRTPHSFYRHKCMNEWKIERTLRHFASALQSGAIAASREKCATSNPFQIYTQLPPSERDMLLKCLGCGKAFSYISGLVSHFKNEGVGGDCVPSFHSSPDSNESLPVAAAIFFATGIVARPVTCDVCAAVSGDQVAYCLHSDHHAFPQREVLTCKRCAAAFESPCKFYGHACSDDRTGTPTAFWCAFCEVNQICDGQRANILRASTELSTALNNPPNGLGRHQPQVDQSALTSHRHPATPVEEPSEIAATGHEVNRIDGRPRSRRGEDKGPSSVLHARKPTSSMKAKNKKHAAAAQKLRTMTTTHLVRRRRSADAAADDSSSLSGAYICPDCNNKIIRDPAALAVHNESTGGGHINVRPLWTYNKLNVKLVDVGLTKSFREKVAKELDLLYEQDMSEEGENNCRPYKLHKS